MGSCSTAHAPDGSTPAGLISGYELVLKGSDKNRDAKLSRAEVQEMVDAGLTRNGSAAPAKAEMRDWLLRDYAAQDVDRDGYLNLDELLEEPLATFTCIDTDSDGLITQSEIQAGMGRCDTGRVHNAHLMLR